MAKAEKKTSLKVRKAGSEDGSKAEDGEEDGKADSDASDEEEEEKMMMMTMKTTLDRSKARNLKMTKARIWTLCQS